MSGKTKKTQLTIPVVNLDKIFGPRGEKMQEQSVDETKSKLMKKKEELEALELDSEILDVEERIRRRRGGEPPTEPQKTLGDKLVEQVVIPIVNKKLTDDEAGQQTNSTVDRALRIAERAVARGQPGADKPKGAIDELEKAISVFKEIKGLIETEKVEKEEAGESVKKESNALTELDRGLDLVRKLRETFPQEEGGGQLSDRMIEFKKWEKEFEQTQRRDNRAERLETRKIDKAHEARLAELGIEKDRNDLLRDGFKRVGRAIALGLGEEDEFEEEEEQAPPKGRKKLIRDKCSVCGVEIMIPPESQIEGKEIKCSKCGSSFVWE